MFSGENNSNESLPSKVEDTCRGSYCAPPYRIFHTVKFLISFHTESVQWSLQNTDFVSHSCFCVDLGVCLASLCLFIIVYIIMAKF